MIFKIYIIVHEEFDEKCGELSSERDLLVFRFKLSIFQTKLLSRLVGNLENGNIKVIWQFGNINNQRIDTTLRSQLGN